MPGSHLVVKYATDPRWCHERLLLWPIAGDRWVVITADNDIYDETIDGYSWFCHVYRRDSALPRDVRNLVMFETLPDRSHMFGLIRRGRLEAQRICAGEGLALMAPDKCVDSDGLVSSFVPDSSVANIRRRLRMRSQTPAPDVQQPGGSSPRRRLQSKMPAPGIKPPEGGGSGASSPRESRGPVRFDLGTPVHEDDLWVVCDPLSSLFGMTSDVEADDPETRYMLKDLHGELSACRRVSVAEAAGFSDSCADQLHARVRRDPPAEPAEHGGLASEPQEHAEVTAPADRSLEALRRKLEVWAAPADGGADDDIRTLPVDYDDHGARWKAWRVVTAEMGSHVFADWGRHLPDGTSVAFDMMGNWERKGGSPQQWLVEWLRDRNIARTERTAIEMKVLTDAITLAGSYGQVNVAALMCMEVLCRRASQIIEAYDGDPGRPNWAGVRYMLGDAHSLNVVPAAARSYNARKIKDEIEVDTARSRGAARPATIGNGDNKAEDAPAGGKAAGRSAGGGAGRGGTAGSRQKARQLQAAADA